MARKQKLLHGALETLILKTLARQPRHGYGIARWIEETTGDAIQVEEGSLYPALYRLQKQGLLDSRWGVSELDRRAKFYELTDAGRARLAAETDQWRRFRDAVSLILET